jgi:hypothetical protein
VAAEGGRVGCASAQFGIYRLQHAVKIAIDLVVPKPKDSKTPPRKTGVAARVARSMFIEIVLPAVEFDDEPMLHTDEVDNETLARRLSPEMKPALSPRAGVNP